MDLEAVRRRWTLSRYDSESKVKISPTSHFNRAHNWPIVSHDVGALFLSCWIVRSPNIFSLRSRYEVYPASFRADSTSILYRSGIVTPSLHVHCITSAYTLSSVQSAQIKGEKIVHLLSAIVLDYSLNKCYYMFA